MTFISFWMTQLKFGTTKNIDKQIIIETNKSTTYIGFYGLLMLCKVTTREIGKEINLSYWE